MKRRSFLRGSLVGGAAALPASAALGASESPVTPGTAGSRDQNLERVKRAMLSMQRASWEQGVAAQACLELGDDELAYLLAKEAALRQTDDGRLSVVYTDNGVTDPAASGEAVLRAAEASGDPDLKVAADRMLRYLLEKAPRSESGTLYHTLNAPEIWVDSMYMAPPFLAAAGEHREAIRQLDGIGEFLWNPDQKLYSHRWHDEKRELVNPDFWGVGNGWAMAGMARVVELLPPALTSERDRLARRARATLDGCLAHLRPDGLFHNVVDKPDSFVETNLSQMAAYTVFRGVRAGWLERGYMVRALAMREAAHRKLDVRGYVRGWLKANSFNAPKPIMIIASLMLDILFG